MPTIVGKEPPVDYKSNPELDPAHVPDPPDFDAPTSPSDASSFGNFMQEKLEKKSQPPPEPAKKETEPVKEVAKDTKPAATTPIADVLDAALSQTPPAPTDTVKPTPSPVDEFSNVTDGVRSEDVKKRMTNMRTKISELWTENQGIIKERDELKGKVRPALEDPEVKKLLESKDAELSKANEALLALNIDSHPDFQKEFVQPRVKMARSAAQKLQSYGGQGQALLDALYMPEGIRRDEAIAGLLENVPDHAKLKINGIVNEIEALDERANEKRAAAPQTWDELNARDLDARRKKVEQYTTQVKTEFDEVTRSLSESPMFRVMDDSVKGSSEWNSDRQGSFERALNHFLGSDNTLKRSMVTTIKGERYDQVEKMLFDERKLRRELEQKLGEYESVQPSPGFKAAPKAKGDDEDKNVPFGELVARRAARREADTD